MFDKYQIVNSELTLYLNKYYNQNIKDMLINFIKVNKIDKIKKIIFKFKNYEFAKIVILDYNIDLARAIYLNQYGVSINLDNYKEEL